MLNRDRRLSARKAIWSDCGLWNDSSDLQH